MITSFLITFRETLEAALVIGIILAFLAKTKNARYNNIVYTAIAAGIIGSVGSALIFNQLAGGFTGKSEQIFEGVTMLVGALLLTTMILWMMKNKHVGDEVKNKISKDIEKHDRFGLFMLAFIAVLREGVETVIFLGAANFISNDNNLLGGILGIAGAIFLGYLIFVASVKVNVKKFFNVSSFLLLLFAAGLVAHGVHEFEEAGILNPMIEHVWDLNPPAQMAGQNIYPPFHENGAMGSLAKGLFGYNGNPSLLEVISYFAYLGLIIVAYKSLNR